MSAKGGWSCTGSRFLSQREDEERSIEQTLDLGWKVVSILPREELHRITEEELVKYYGK